MVISTNRSAPTKIIRLWSLKNFFRKLLSRSVSNDIGFADKKISYRYRLSVSADTKPYIDFVKMRFEKEIKHSLSEQKKTYKRYNKLVLPCQFKSCSNSLTNCLLGRRMWKATAVKTRAASRSFWKKSIVILKIFVKLHILFQNVCKVL